MTAQGAGGRWHHVRAITDPDGRFVLDALHPYEASLWIRPARHFGAVVRPRLHAGRTVTMEIPLTRAPLLVGTVVDATDGTPVALMGADVPSSPRRHVRLLDEGRFEVAAKKHGTQVVVQARGYPDTSCYFEGTNRKKVFRLARGVLLRVHAIDEADRPIDGTRVSFIRQGSMTRWRNLETDASGELVVQLPRGSFAESWRTRAAHAGFVFEVENFKLGELAEQELVLRGVRGGHLEGRVVARSGTPVAGVKVSVGAQRYARTVDDGRFRLGPMKPGRIEVLASDPSGDSTRRGDVEVRAGETTRLGDLVLEPGVSITGYVTDPNGRRLARYVVWSDKRQGVVENGEFRVSGLQRGEVYTVTVRTGTVVQQVKGIVAGTRDLEIRLDDYATIRGRVTVSRGDEIPLGFSMGCAAVGRRPSYPIMIRNFTDGTFVIEGVPAGRYRLSASAEASGYARATAEVEVKAGETREVELRLVKGGTIEGRVETDLPGKRVSVRLLRGDPDAAQPETVSFSMLGQDGLFRLPVIAPGEYTLEAYSWDPGRRGTRQVVRVRAGGTTRAALAVVATGTVVVRALPGTPLRLLDGAGHEVAVSGAERRALRGAIWKELKRQGDPTRAEIDSALQGALARAGTNGMWQRTELFPGKYRVEASGELHEVEVGPGSVSELNVR